MAFGHRRSLLPVFFLCCLRICYTEHEQDSDVNCYQSSASTYTFVKHAVQAPPVSYYDYIIVGGGTAGCPLAATLSEKHSVLLLERGGSPYGNKNITELACFSQNLADTSPASPSQRFLSEDGVINARARVLGGGSCLNAGFYTRASPEYVRDVGWNGTLVNQSYQWVEKMVAFEPPMLQWQSAVRDGLLEAGITPYNGFTYDHMYGTKIGGTIFDRDGHRHTAADLLQYANPDGLMVLLHATVGRILFRQTGGAARPVAHGVVFHDAAGVRHRAYLNNGAKNEIVVCAGAVGSPQLLMLSGVGPRDHLESLAIDVVVDQPMVGQSMSDNPMNAIFVPSPTPVEVSLIQVVGITRFGSFIEGASGSNFASLYSQITRELRFGMFSAQTGKIFTINDMNDLPAASSSMRGGFILEKIMGPLSTGHLDLKNKNPDDNPSVTFNYFKEPEDLQRCVKGIETIEKVIQSKAFSRFRFQYISTEELLRMALNFPMNLLPKHDNASKSLEQFCKDTVMTIWHYHGGCQVGQVVDKDYKVVGVDALRVVDGSTFNFSPGTNPQATVMMLGRYMGIKIQTERRETDDEVRRKS
ncbi:unnamed protein product [Musa acuminata subsp. burmannicoides]